VCDWIGDRRGHSVEDFSSNLTATMVYHDDGTVTAFPMGEPGTAIHALATATTRRTQCTAKFCFRTCPPSEFASSKSSPPTPSTVCGMRICGWAIEWMSAVANRLPMMVVAGCWACPTAMSMISFGSATPPPRCWTASSRRHNSRRPVPRYSSCPLRDGAFREAVATSEPGLMSDLAARCSCGELEQIAALAMMITLFSAAGESTASLLGSAAWILGTRRNPNAVREDPTL